MTDQQNGWVAPRDAAPPADGWQDNQIAVRSRTLVLCAAGGVALGLVLVFFGVFSTTYLLLAGYGIAVVAVIASVIAIILASIGIYRSGRLGGYRRGVALAALCAAIAVAVFTFPLILLVNRIGLIAFGF